MTQAFYHILHYLRMRWFSRPAGRVMSVLLPVLVIITFLPTPANAGKKEDENIFFETSVFLVVQGVGSVEVPATIYNETAYLSVSDVFDFLKIRNRISSGADTVSGTFITEQARFIIDKNSNRIYYQDKVFELKADDLFNTATSLYMRKDLFSEVFGLDCNFNFRGLSVNMSTRQELPAIRELRLEAMRRNINRLKGQTAADTVIGQKRPFFQLGMADWAVIATQRVQQANDTRLNLSLGASLAGGEAIVSLNYNNYAKRQVSSEQNPVRPFSERQQFYRWRYVDNNNPLVKQVIAGKIFTQSTASVFDPVVGAQITNAPTICRRAFGSYTLTDHTDPNWTVELYMNNELVDYTKADAAGMFTFQVPLIYGNSVMRLRYYGPFGEERTREEHISIPFNFLPKNEFQYTLSAGMVQDGRDSRFGRAIFNYGATRHITLGGGVEYLSSVTSGSIMPFVNTSVRLAPGLLFAADYTYGVRARGMLTYRRRDNMQADLYYARYDRNQTAIIYNFLEERKLIISRPFTGRNISAFSRLTLNQIVLPGSRYTTGEWLIAGAFRGINTNLTTYAVMMEQARPFVYTNFSLSFRLPARFTLTPQIQYEYNENKVMAARFEVAKYIFRNGYLNCSYQQNFKSHFSNIGIGLRYDFAFARVGVSAWQGNDVTTLVQSAAGSLIYEQQSRLLDINNRIGVGTGGVLLLPFLDLNGNGRRDAGEPKVRGLQAVTNGGLVTNDKQDTTIRIMNLEPYTSLFIDLRKNNFEQIAWRVRQQTISVVIDPNRVKLVEVPVVVMGEASGTIYQQINNQEQTLGRITVIFRKEDGTTCAKVYSETDGYFSFSGLLPGNYTASVDTAQLQRLGMTVSPVSIPFSVSQHVEGDVVEGLKFVLRKMDVDGEK